jgi:hypothetical protein
MPRPQKPFVIQKRSDYKTFIITLNVTSGLPYRVCQEWKRKSFQNFPDELIIHSNPKTKNAAYTAAIALIGYLKKKQQEGNTHKVIIEDVTVGDWIEKFTKIETSPRTGINAAKNRSYSEDTFDTYRSYYDTHIKADLFCLLKMAEVEEEDTIEFCTRLSLRKKNAAIF